MDIDQKDKKHGGVFILDVSAELDDIKLRLGKLSDKAPAVLSKALNDTAKWAGRELASSAQARYRVQKLKFAREFHIKRATKSRLMAELLSEGHTLPASNFKISPAKPKTSPKGSLPVKLAVLKKSSPQFVTNGDGLRAFVTEFQSGHVAVVWRTPPDTYTTRGWAVRSGRWDTYFRTHRKLDKTKIEELNSPSAPKMLEKAGVLAQFIGNDHPEILNHLQQAITTRINTELYFASKGGKR